MHWVSGQIAIEEDIRPVMEHRYLGIHLHPEMQRA